MKMFIVGAGFTKAVFPEAPVNRELIDQLQKESRESVSPKLRDRYATSDIEIALTKLDADLALLDGQRNQHKELLTLRLAIESELGIYFARFSASEQIITERPWLVAFADKVFSDGDVVVSLNYDCLLEGVLDSRGRWSPKGGYGSSMSHPLIDDAAFPQSPVVVLKIHGSSNFEIAPYIDKPTANSVGFAFDERFFPRSAKHTHFGFGAGTGRTYLIAPSYVKLPTVEIAYLMLDALAAAATAEKLVVVGCALRPEDAFLNLIATHFFRQPNWRSRRIIVLDPNAGEICARVQKYWGVDISEQLVAVESDLARAVDKLEELVGSAAR